MSRVLVVDDCDVVRQAVVRVLERAGHEVESASSGAVALGLVRRAAPDLVVTDVRMPSMDGVQLHREVCALLGSEGPAVLFISGSPVDEVRARVGPRGRVGFLQKPFDVDRLAAQVEVLLDA